MCICLVEIKVSTFSYGRKSSFQTLKVKTILKGDAPTSLVTTGLLKREASPIHWFNTPCYFLLLNVIRFFTWIILSLVNGICSTQITKLLQTSLWTYFEPFLLRDINRCQKSKVSLSCECLIGSLSLYCSHGNRSHSVWISLIQLFAAILGVRRSHAT